MAKGALALTLLLAACATTQDALESKHKGTAKVYPVTESQAWEIAKKVFRWEGADAIEEDRPNRVLLTSSGTDVLSYGTVMACWIEPEGAGGTKVTIVTKRRSQLGLFTTLTEGTFHTRFQQGVDIVRSGRELPVQPPAITPPDQR